MTETRAALLEVTSLRVEYGNGSVGVEDVGLHVQAGEIVAMLGANGAGKSTTLRAISGVFPSERISITNGTVVFDGKQVAGLLPDRLVRRGMVLVPERDKVFRTLTVEENLRVGLRGEARRLRAQNEQLVFDMFRRLADVRKKHAGLLSGGERQMLGIGKALMLAPRILLADELSLGIAPVLVDQLIESISTVSKEQGLAVLLVEQNAAAALSIANRAYILEVGHVVREGTPRDLVRDDAVRSSYLRVTG